MNRFWKWLLGFNEVEKEEEPKSRKASDQGGSKSTDSTDLNEGNTHSGPEGYQSGEYEGR